MALRMVAVAMVWHVSILTKSTLSVGILGLSEVIPAVAFALYAGHVVDISDRRKLLVRSMFFYLASILLLLIVTSGKAEQSFSHHAIALGIYTCIFFTGVIRSFSGPAFNAMTAQVATRENLPKAVTLSSASWQVASVVGPLLTGFLIAIGGATYTLIFIIFCVVVAVICMSGIKPKPVLLAKSEKKTWESVKEGIRFVMNTKAILGALSLDLFAVFFGGATAMLSFYVTDILKVGPIWFGWLNAATSIGTIGVLIAISIWPLAKNQGRILLYAVAGFGVCIIVFGLSKNIWLSLAALLLSGIFDGLSVVIRSTIMQIFVPDEMRGRVASVNSIFINSSNELGQFESGVAARIMGTVPSVVFGGCMTLFVVAVTWFKAPALKKMKY
jgi:MFS family permease